MSVVDWRASSWWRTLRRQDVWWSAVAGALVCLLVVVAGLIFVLRRPTQWRAEAAIVVLPAARLDALAQAGYYETLSRGQVVATFAQMLRLRRFENQAADRLGLSESARKRVQVSVQVVPDTAMITIGTSAPSPSVAVRMSDAVLDATQVYVVTLNQPFRLETVSRADGTARSEGLARAPFLAVLVLVGLVGGLATQQAVYQLNRILLFSSRSSRPAISFDSSVEPEATRGKLVGSESGDGPSSGRAGGQDHQGEEHQERVETRRQ